MSPPHALFVLKTFLKLKKLKEEEKEFWNLKQFKWFQLENENRFKIEKNRKSTIARWLQIVHWIHVKPVL